MVTNKKPSLYFNLLTSFFIFDFHKKIFYSCKEIFFYSCEEIFFHSCKEFFFIRRVYDNRTYNASAVQELSLLTKFLSIKTLQLIVSEKQCKGV